MLTYLIIQELEGGTNIPVLQMKKLSLREIKEKKEKEKKKVIHGSWASKYLLITEFILRTNKRLEKRQ